jgi:hypothetical protein
MPIGIDKQLELANDVTLTSSVILPTGTNTTAWDRGVAGNHTEFGNPFGLAVFPTAVSASGTETYEFQIINDSDKALATTPKVVATTGTMANTDERLSRPFFLPVEPGMISMQFLGAKFVGANSPSIEFSAWFMSQKDFEQYAAAANNYTV